MAKKKGTRGSKDKGRARYGNQGGLGRLRRANAKSRTRVGDWSRHSDDDHFLDKHDAGDERIGDSGASLLAKFNRLARNATDANGISGEISGFEGTHTFVRLQDGSEVPCTMRRVLKKMFAGVKTPLCVGDRVVIETLSEGDHVINGIHERYNQLERADSHNKALVQVFAANIDHLAIVTSIAMPELKTGLIDRYLVIAHANDITPIIVLNKCDLANADAAAALYRGLGYTVFQTHAGGEQGIGGDIDTLRQFLRGSTAVFAGQSGVGKSSLVNALFPEIGARIGDVSNVLSKGRHTTTASRSYALSDGGRLIDTPGIRECGITGLQAIDVALHYRDIAAHHHDCHFSNCTHIHEPDCAVQAAVESNIIPVSRYASYCSIVLEDLAP